MRASPPASVRSRPLLLPHGGVATFAVLFLFGTLAASMGWRVTFLWWLSGACAAIALWRMRDDPMTMTNVLVASSALPLAGLYYHLRMAGFGGVSVMVPSFPPPIPRETGTGTFASSFSAALPYREASLLDAIWSGSTAELPADVRSAMARAGTSYIVGMYGFKIHLLADTIRRLASFYMSRRIAMGFMMGAVAAFIAYAGMPRAAMRAGAMTVVGAMAEMTGRRIAPWRALLFTGLALIIIDPSSWKSAGFLLSFASIAGIFIIATPLRAMFAGRDILSWKSHVAMAFAVNAAIIPLVALSYGSFPMISFLSNALIALPFSAIMILGTALALAHATVPYAAFALGPPLTALLGFQIAVSRMFGAVPLMVSGTLFSPFMTVAYYAVLGICAYHLRKARTFPGMRTSLFHRIIMPTPHA